MVAARATNVKEGSHSPLRPATAARAARSAPPVARQRRASGETNGETLSRRHATAPGRGGDLMRVGGSAAVEDCWTEVA